MPEGHTLHRLALDLTEAFGGRVVDGDQPAGPVRRVGRRAGPDPVRRGHGARQAPVLRVRRRAVPARPPRPDRQVPARRPRPDRGARYGSGSPRREQAADLRGPQLCVVATRAEIDAAMAGLGPDPLRPDADPELAWRRIRRASRPIAALVMDQTILSGVGNVYRAEVLFRNRINPHRPGQQAEPEELDRHLVGPGRTDARGRTRQPDRHRPAGAHPGGDGSPAALGQSRRRGLRLPAGGDGLPGLRLEGADRAAGRAQPVLVRSVPTPGLTFPFGPGAVTVAEDGRILQLCWPTADAAGGRPPRPRKAYLTGGGG